jgi:hypothetical protein
MTGSDESEPMGVLEHNEETLNLVVETAGDCQIVSPPAEESEQEQALALALVLAQAQATNTPTQQETDDTVGGNRGEDNELVESETQTPAGESRDVLVVEHKDANSDDSNPAQSLEAEDEEQTEGEQSVVTDFATQRRMEQEKEIQKSANEVIEPLKMLRKGATALVGGTILGVGLIMIPLPTPCGCIVASSGLALLGSEFEGARKMNDNLIDKTKTNLVMARDKLITTIESLNSNDEWSEDEKESEETEDSPSWLSSMNPAERKRQEKLMKEKYRRENRSTNEQFREYVTKRTGSFLSRALLPVLTRTKSVKGAASEDASSEQPAVAAQQTENAEDNTSLNATIGTENSNLEDSFVMIDINEDADSNGEANVDSDSNAKVTAL